MGVTAQDSMGTARPCPQGTYLVMGKGQVYRVTRRTLPMTTLASEPTPTLKHDDPGPHYPTLPGNSPHCLSLPCTVSARGPRWPSGDGLPRPSVGGEKTNSPPCFENLFPLFQGPNGKDPLGTHTSPTRAWERSPVAPMTKGHDKRDREEWRSL